MIRAAIAHAIFEDGENNRLTPRGETVLGMPDLREQNLEFSDQLHNSILNRFGKSYGSPALYDNLRLGFP